MQVTTGLPPGIDPEYDRLLVAQREHRATVDPTGDYTREKVSIGRGETRKEVTVKVPWDEPFAYVVYGDNPDHQDLEERDWQRVVVNVLEKFAAIKGVTIKTAPRTEAGTRFNYVVEFNKEIQIRPETQELRDRRAAAIAAEQARRERVRQMARDFAGGPA